MSSMTEHFKFIVIYYVWKIKVDRIKWATPIATFEYVVQVNNSLVEECKNVVVIDDVEFDDEDAGAWEEAFINEIALHEPIIPDTPPLNRCFTIAAIPQSIV